ncbi:hypothetical protein C8R45DRAFT_927658 [Mycena sanguinolenta]|nr:hypothetical protein C8R45DRAFT_927658 [Mycena sanguinolenta]
MVNPSSQEPTAATPEQELAALVSRVAAVAKLAVNVSNRCLDVHDTETSKLALEITRQCIDIGDKIPQVVRTHVDAALEDARPPTPAFYEYVAPTPAEVDEKVPEARSDNQTWHVVCVGRQPGLYATYEEADDQVRGVPDQSRRKVVGRDPALAYYRHMYEHGKVTRLTETPP